MYYRDLNSLTISKENLIDNQEAKRKHGLAVKTNQNRIWTQPKTLTPCAPFMANKQDKLRH